MRLCNRRRTLLVNLLLLCATVARSLETETTQSDLDIRATSLQNDGRSLFMSQKEHEKSLTVLEELRQHVATDRQASLHLDSRDLLRLRRADAASFSHFFRSLLQADTNIKADAEHRRTKEHGNIFSRVAPVTKAPVSNAPPPKGSKKGSKVDNKLASKSKESKGSAKKIAKGGSKITIKGTKGSKGLKGRGMSKGLGKSQAPSSKRTKGIKNAKGKITKAIKSPKGVKSTKSKVSKSIKSAIGIKGIKDATPSKSTKGMMKEKGSKKTKGLNSSKAIKNAKGIKSAKNTKLSKSKGTKAPKGSKTGVVSNIMKGASKGLKGGDDKTAKISKKEVVAGGQQGNGNVDAPTSAPKQSTSSTEAPILVLTIAPQTVDTRTPSERPTRTPTVPTSPPTRIPTTPSPTGAPVIPTDSPTRPPTVPTPPPTRSPASVDSLPSSQPASIDSLAPAAAPTAQVVR